MTLRTGLGLILRAALVVLLCTLVPAGLLLFFSGTSPVFESIAPSTFSWFLGLSSLVTVWWFVASVWLVFSRGSREANWLLLANPIIHAMVVVPVGIWGFGIAALGLGFFLVGGAVTVAAVLLLLAAVHVQLAGFSCLRSPNDDMRRASPLNALGVATIFATYWIGVSGDWELAGVFVLLGGVGIALLFFCASAASVLAGAFAVPISEAMDAIAPEARPGRPTEGSAVQERTDAPLAARARGLAVGLAVVASTLAVMGATLALGPGSPIWWRWTRSIATVPDVDGRAPERRRLPTARDEVRPDRRSVGTVEADALPWAGDRRGSYVEEAVGRALDPDANLDLRKLPELFVGPIPDSVYVAPATTVPATRELHAVGIYKPPEGQVSPEGVFRPRPVTLVIHPTAAPLSLVLISCEKASWELQPDASVRLEHVYLGGPPGSAVTGWSGAVEAIEGTDSSCKYKYDPTAGGDGDDGAVLHAGVLHRLGALAGSRVSTFQGAYRGEAFSVPFYHDVSVVQEILDAHRALPPLESVSVSGAFVLAESDRVVRWGPDAPPHGLSIELPEASNIKAVAFARASGFFYAITNHDLIEFDPSTGWLRNLEPPSDYPPLSWLGSVAYDEGSGRVVITTRWHTGYHHLYEPGSATWRAFPIEKTGGGLDAVAYDDRAGEIYGLGSEGLATYDARLNLIRKVHLSEPLRVRADRTKPRGVGTQMAVVNEGILVCETPYLRREARPLRCSLVKLPSGDVVRADVRLPDSSAARRGDAARSAASLRRQNAAPRTQPGVCGLRE